MREPADPARCAAPLRRPRATASPPARPAPACRRFADRLAELLREANPALEYRTSRCRARARARSCRRADRADVPGARARRGDDRLRRQRRAAGGAPRRPRAHGRLRRTPWTTLADRTCRDAVARDGDHARPGPLPPAAPALGGDGSRARSSGSTTRPGPPRPATACHASTSPPTREALARGNYARDGYHPSRLRHAAARRGVRRVIGRATRHPTRHAGGHVDACPQRLRRRCRSRRLASSLAAGR